MTPKPTGLGAGLVKRKGDAAPSAAPTPEPTTAPQSVEATPAHTQTPTEPEKPPVTPQSPVIAAMSAPTADQLLQRTPKGQQYHKALTLKLDAERYKALKLIGLEQGTTSQEILVEALDLWLASQARAQ